MSLDELRALAEEDDATTPEVDAVDEQDELNAGSSDDGADDTDDQEASDDFELELDGEPEPERLKPSAQEALIHKLTKERKKRQQASSEVDELRSEADELRAQIAEMQKAQGQRPEAKTPDAQYPPVPLLYENGVDTPEQYSRAYQKWVDECKRVDATNTQRVQQNDDYAKSMRTKTEGLAKRAAQFATDNKVSIDRVADALNRATDEVDGATKIEGSLAYLLDSVGDGGERVAYYIGTNESAMARMKQLLQEDPNGFKAIAHMTRLAEQLKPKHSKRISKAPAPDESLRGDGSPASSRKLQEAYDKASAGSDLKVMRDIQKRATELGVKLT